MEFKAKYFCLDGERVRKRSNTIRLDFTTDKYETILEEVKKASTWDGEIVLHSIDKKKEDEFGVGDVVKFGYSHGPQGMVGTIVDILDEGATQPYLVQFDEFHRGHSGQNRMDEGGGGVIIPDKTGWWCSKSELTEVV